MCKRPFHATSPSITFHLVPARNKVRGTSWRSMEAGFSGMDSGVCGPSCVQVKLLLVIVVWEWLSWMFAFTHYHGKKSSPDRKSFYSAQHQKCPREEEPRSDTCRDRLSEPWNHPPATGHVKHCFFFPVQKFSPKRRTLGEGAYTITNAQAPSLYFLVGVTWCRIN